MGDSDKEVYPQDVVAIAECGSGGVFEGDRCWDAMERDIISYKDIVDMVVVEEIGRGKLLVMDGVRIIPPPLCEGGLAGKAS